LPGVAAGISIVLILLSSQTIPFNIAGLLLMILGVIFFILEVYVVSYGMLAIVGLVSFLAGSLLLFNTPEGDLQVSLQIIAGATTAMALVMLTAGYLIVKAMRARPISGAEGIVDKLGQVDNWSGREGKVIVDGEYWNASGDEGIQQGDKIVVQSINGLNLTVRKQ
jgi:membrane-bound serine protease (ClpP class)